MTSKVPSSLQRWLPPLRKGWNSAELLCEEQGKGAAVGGCGRSWHGFTLLFGHFLPMNSTILFVTYIHMYIFCLFVLSCFVFLGPHPQHMEVPRLGVQPELQLPAYTTVTATPDLSHVCNLHPSSRPHRILNPLSETRNRTHNLLVPSWIH